MYDCVWFIFAYFLILHAIWSTVSIFSGVWIMVIKILWFKNLVSEPCRKSFTSLIEVGSWKRRHDQPMFLNRTTNTLSTFQASWMIYKLRWFKRLDVSIGMGCPIGLWYNPWILWAYPSLSHLCFDELDGNEMVHDGISYLFQSKWKKWNIIIYSNHKLVKNNFKWDGMAWDLNKMGQV